MSARPTAGHEFVLTVSCADKPGLVYAVSSYLIQHSGNIRQSQQYDDRDTGEFFMRVHFDVAGPGTLDDLRAGFGHVAESFRMRWNLDDAATPTRTLVMVSKFGHCLNELLFRHRSGRLNIEIPAIVSNHIEFAGLAESYGIPFHHVPVTAESKDDAEAELRRLVSELSIDLVVLARYMQVLSPQLCHDLRGQAINIHHSFLPSFKGAKPYHQAHGRGVKLIGATAHYITDELDEGPIIEQDVTRVDHTFDAGDLVAAGADVESQVLSRAVQWHSERRVLLNGNRTVVFR
jgi:formyltetrahydrofolate deformylase